MRKATGSKSSQVNLKSQRSASPTTSTSAPLSSKNKVTYTPTTYKEQSFPSTRTTSTPSTAKSNSAPTTKVTNTSPTKPTTAPTATKTTSIPSTAKPPSSKATDPTPTYKTKSTPSTKTTSAPITTNTTATKSSLPSSTDTDTRVTVISEKPAEPEKTKQQLDEENRDYNPYEFRNVKNPTNNAETLIHLLKGSIGTGILAMPLAIHHSGYVLGPLLTFALGGLCTYLLHVLLRNQYILCKRRRLATMTYPESMQYALQTGPSCLRCLAPASPWIVDFYLIFYQLGICSCYIVFVGSNMKDVWGHFHGDVDIRIHMSIILIPLILLNCVRNLKVMAPFSTLANLIVFIGLGIIFYYVLRETLPVSDRDPLSLELQHYALFFGTVLFALEAVGVIIALESNMKTPADFRGWFGILNIGMLIVVTLYAAFGFLGYLRYGKECKGSITLNLPEDQTLSICVRIMMALSVFFSHALQCYVPISMIYFNYMEKHLREETKIYWEFGIRITLVLITFLMAMGIPKLGLFISLVGAFALSALGIIFPATLELCTLWGRPQFTCSWTFIKDICLIIFGFFGLIVGTYVSIMEIVTSFQKED